MCQDEPARGWGCWVRFTFESFIIGAELFEKKNKATVVNVKTNGKFQEK